MIVIPVPKLAGNEFLRPAETDRWKRVDMGGSVIGDDSGGPAKSWLFGNFVSKLISVARLIEF